MEPIIDASHVYIRYLLGDFRDIGLKEWTIQKVKRERPLVGGRCFFHTGKR